MNKKILLGSAFTLLAVAPVVAPVASAAEAVTTKASDDLFVDVITAEDQLASEIEKAKNDADKAFFKAIASKLDGLNTAILEVRETKKANEDSASKYQAALDTQAEVIAKQLENNTKLDELTAEKAELEVAKKATVDVHAKEIAKLNKAEADKMDADAKLAKKGALKTALKEAKDAEYAYRVTGRNTAIKAISDLNPTLTIAEVEEKYNEQLVKLQEAIVEAQKPITKAEEKLAKAEAAIKESKAKIEAKEALVEKQNAAIKEVANKLAKETKAQEKLAKEFTKAQEEVAKTSAAFLANQKAYNTAVDVFNAKRDALKLDYIKENREFNIDKIVADLDASLVDQAEKDSKANTWELKDGNWYYYNEKGELVTGWLKDGDHWYFFNEDNTMKTGWLKDGGHSYYLRSNGQMARGWEVVDGKYYMFKAWGPMATNEWMPYGGQWFFLQADGVMATNTTINGWTVDASGAWV